MILLVLSGAFLIASFAIHIAVAVRVANERVRRDLERALVPRVCPGCAAVDEPCAEDCPNHEKGARR